MRLVYMYTHCLTILYRCVHTCFFVSLQIKGMQVTTGAYLSLLEVRNFKAVTTHKVIVSK